MRNSPRTSLAESPTSPSLMPSAAKSCGRCIRRSTGTGSLDTLLRPVIRLLVGFIAIPLFRMFLRRVVHLQRLDTELTKDLEQWVRGSLLLLVTTQNVEYALFGEFLDNLGKEYVWLS